MKTGFVYIITNKNNTTLYVGVTSNLPERILAHIEKRHEGSWIELVIHKDEKGNNFSEKYFKGPMNE